METSAIISAIVFGIVVGTLGLLAAPGSRRIGLRPTIAVGIVAALAGTGIAVGLGLAGTKGVSWIEWVIQIALAAVGVVVLGHFRARA
ncbi:GlsB/YeaQ/YmgE family stress response membrane protein [Streptomyces sp. NPDC058434]|uniref:GlsB/YeaQ/YmgE family stress response membrane protein n=1 Tax=Streptomyces sp. NPDC058434 TaxID=3346498 RepID=UPI003659369E